jgi:hypothetical protein
MKRFILFITGLAACGTDSLPPSPDAAVDDDPLAVTSTAPAGSLDELHARVISMRCSGQPGLCHNGQFEPNLSTPALTYAYVVNRPGIEKADRLRVKPGDPSGSLFIDKIRNRNGVATQMPLGAEPLEEADIQAIEKWITDGALRSPGADPAPVLNNPPKRPQRGVFDTAGNRLDNGEQLNVNVGQTIVLRHTVQDFETADNAIPFSGVNLQLGNNKAVVLDPANDDPQTGTTAFDATNPPMGIGDAMNRERTFTIPTNLPRIDTVTKVQDSIPAAGVDMYLQAFYIDELDLGPPIMFGMIAFESATFTIHINP